MDRRRQKDRRRADTQPYQPGQFDRLLTPRALERPIDLTGVSFSVSPTGELRAEQHTCDGRSPATIIRSTPFSIDIASPTGGEFTIEVRFFGSDTTAIAPITSDFISAGGSRIWIPGDPFDFGPEERGS
jgi:hypothetical protein